MNEYENNTNPSPFDTTPSKQSTGTQPQWNSPDSFLSEPPVRKQAPVTPPPAPAYPQAPVYDPNATPRKRAVQEESGMYSTGALPPVKKSKSWLIALIVSIVVLSVGLLTALGLIPGLPNYRFKDDSSPNITANDPGFESDNTPSATENTVPIISSTGDSSIDLESIPNGQNEENPEGVLTLQEIYTKTIASVTSIICDTGTGTGVVMTKDGYVITNYHVIKGARSVEVLLSDGRRMPAQTIGRDEISDLAVLRINANDLTPAVFANSDQVQVGDTVVAIGDPLGVELRGTMTDGIISAINRDVVTDMGRTMTVIQTNAALNPGNSGGPLINVYGQVIGINTMKIGDNVAAAGVEGLGFAIPSTTVKTIVDQLISIGHVTGRPYLGIDTEEYGVVMSYLLPPGLYISHVVPGTDAAAKGITAGEVLLEFNGTAVTTNYELQNALEKCEPGQTVTLVLYRQGRRASIEVVLGEAQ